MGVARYVNMAFVASGLLAWVVLADFFQWAIELVGPSHNSQIIGHNFRVADLIGLVVAFGFDDLRRRHDTHPYLRHGGRQRAFQGHPARRGRDKLATIVTIIVTVIIAMILEGFDYLWAALSSLVYNV